MSKAYASRGLALLMTFALILMCIVVPARADSEELEVEWSEIAEPVEFGSYPIVSFACNCPSNPTPSMFIDGEQYRYHLFGDVEDDVLFPLHYQNC